MGKQIQIVGANNAPYVAKELDLESGNQFTFAKPDGTDVVEVGALDFIKAIEEYDTFKDWVVNYKRDENTIIPLRIDKIEGNVDTEKIVYTFTNDDVDVSSITLVKLIVEMVNATNEISASYVDETKEIEAGTVLPTPSADDIGKFLKVADDLGFEYGEAGGGSVVEVDITSYGENATLADLCTALGIDITQSELIYEKEVYITYSHSGTNSYKGLLFVDRASYYGSNTRITARHFSISTGGGEYDYREVYGNVSTILVDDFLRNYDNQYKHVFKLLPQLPSDASTKTLTLKAVNGTLAWVEEQA